MPVSDEIYKVVKKLVLNDETCKQKGKEIYEAVKGIELEILQNRKPISGGALHSRHEFETAAKNLVWSIEGNKIVQCYRDSAGNVVSFKIETAPSRVMYGNLGGLGSKAKLKSGKDADKRKLSVTVAMGNLKTMKLDLDPKNAVNQRRETQEAMVVLLRMMIIQYCLVKARTPTFQYEEYSALEKEVTSKDWYLNMVKETEEEKGMDREEKKAAKSKRIKAANEAVEFYIFEAFIGKVNRPFTDASPKADKYFGAQYKIKYNEKGLPVLNEQGEPVLETDATGQPIVVPSTTIKMSRADFFDTKATDPVPPIDPRILDIAANPKNYTEEELKFAQEVIQVQGPQSKVRKHFDPVKVAHAVPKETNKPFPVFGPFFGRGSTVCVRCNPGFFNESTSFGMNLYFEYASVFDIHFDAGNSEIQHGYNYDDDEDEKPKPSAEDEKKKAEKEKAEKEKAEKEKAEKEKAEKEKAENNKKRPATEGDDEEEEPNHGYNVEPDDPKQTKKKFKSN